MTITSLSGLPATHALVGGSGQPSFAQTFASEALPNKVPAQQQQATAPKPPPVEPAPSKLEASSLIGHVQQAQTRMDKVLAMAERGKVFSPAELLSLQAQVYRASQELDLAGKVVEKATGGVKQVLQTQL